MSQRVLDFIKTIPLGGGYDWDPKVNAHGVPADIVFKGTTILKKDTATYCTGLTFWTWFQVYGQHLDITVEAMKLVQRRWYCAMTPHNRGGCQDSLIAINQGAKQTIETAQPGDFCQLWRTTSEWNGHSVIFITKNEKYIHYWSTQESSNGVGYRSEPIHRMKELYFVRPLEPQTVIV